MRKPNFHVQPSSLRLYNDSKLRFSKRVNFDVACQMDFHLFPFDHQSCQLKLESFGQTTKELQFRWAKGGNSINPNISLAQFNVDVELQESYQTDYYELNYPGMRIVQPSWYMKGISMIAEKEKNLLSLAQD